MIAPTPPLPVTFTPTEWQALRVLRTSYRRYQGLWTSQELAHLHFLRWLYRTGRLTP